MKINFILFTYTLILGGHSIPIQTIFHLSESVKENAPLISKSDRHTKLR